MSMVSMSDSGETAPSTWTTSGSSKARTTWQMASASRMLARNLLPRPSPSDAPATMPAMSTKETVAGMTFSEPKISASRSSRASGGDDTDVGLDRRERVVRREDGVLVRALNMVDLPTLGSPTIPMVSATGPRVYRRAGASPTAASSTAPPPVTPRRHPPWQPVPEVAAGLLEQGPGRLTTRCHHPVELVELEQPGAGRRQRHHPGAAPAGHVHRAAAAQRHRAHQRLAEARRPRPPRPVDARDPRADLHGHDRPLVALDEQVGGEVVWTLPSTSRRPSSLGAGGQSTGRRHEATTASTRPPRSCTCRSRFVRSTLTTRSRRGRPSKTVSAPRPRRSAPITLLAFGQRSHRRGLPVEQRVPADELRVAEVLERVAVVAHRVPGGDDRPHARARHPVDPQAGVLQLAQHPDRGERTGRAAGEHDAEGTTGEAVGEGADPDRHVAVDEGELPRVGRRAPRDATVRQRRGPDEHDLRPAAVAGEARGHLGVGPGDEHDGVGLPQAELAPRAVIGPGAVALGSASGDEHDPVVVDLRPRQAVRVDPSRVDHVEVDPHPGRQRPSHLLDRCTRWTPTTDTTDGRSGGGADDGGAAVRSCSATWVRTNREARASVSSTESNDARVSSRTVASRRARTVADRGSPVSSASSPMTAPGRPRGRAGRRRTPRAGRDGPRTPSRPVALAHQVRAGRHVDQPRVVLEPTARLGGQRRHERDPAEVGGRRRDREAGRPLRGRVGGVHVRWVGVPVALGLRRRVDPAQRQRGGGDDEEGHDREHPAVAEGGHGGLRVGPPRTTTRTAMPSTPPSARALELIADAVA